MLEIDVTRLIAGNLEPAMISGSIAELGRDAARFTWNNAKEGARRLLKPGERDKARDYFAEFGAWSREELARMSATEIDALVLQYAAGDLRELQSLAAGDGLGGIDWQEAESLAERGTCSGNLFPHDGRLFISLSN